MSESSWGRKRYRTTNWKAYNAALKARGDLTTWLDKDMQWLALPGSKPERSKSPSDARHPVLLDRQMPICRIPADHMMIRDATPIERVCVASAQHSACIRLPYWVRSST